MSNLERHPREVVCGGADRHASEVLTGHPVALGGPRAMTVHRLLPGRQRRMIGPWCFLDAYGPEVTAMRVPPHPHTGLQTVTWLVEGEVLHRDSLGSQQAVRPGQLNLMTAGRGISHSEESAETLLHGVQLWVALPGEHRHVAPGFEHHAGLPEEGGIRVVMGSLAGMASPATCHSPLVCAEISVAGGLEVPVDPAFEHGVLWLSSGEEPSVAYLPPGRTTITLSGHGRALLIGGEPFGEEIVMWWNFVGRTHEEIAAYRKEWAEGEGFGRVAGFAGAPLPAPALPTVRLKPRGRVR
ncbi:pirin family protein [Thermoactinospora rubra]|uniref:pirin family protein n=1 Tax=Thermoactinospora rubra TaxID=1088767 RepID=UPI000A0FEFC5|nr:pirin family protein [Thermoactinospora rubra]